MTRAGGILRHRRRASLVAALVAALLGAGSHGRSLHDAGAEELHLLAAGDAFLTTDGTTPFLGIPCVDGPHIKQLAPTGQDCYGNSLGDASKNLELGLTLQAEARHLGRWELRLDYRARLALDYNTSRSELFSLYATVHDLADGHLDVSFGRFAAPGGLWLIVDGAALRMRTGDLSVTAYGGLRAFSTGRVEMNLTSSFTALPIAGVSATYARPWVIASVGAAFAQDRIDLHHGWVEEGNSICSLQPGAPASPTGGCLAGTVPVNARGGDVELLVNDVKNQPLVENELFVDANLLLFPHPRWTLAGSVLLATRYDLQFDSLGAGYNVTSVNAATLGSFVANALVEYKPAARLRIAYLFDFDRVRIFQSSTPAGADAAGGSFEDHTLKASWSAWHGVRLDARYRVRFRENSDVIHRVEGGLWGDALALGLGAFATVGVDEYQSFYKFKTVPSGDGMGGMKKVYLDPSRLVWQAGVSYVRPSLEVRAGLLYTDVIGDCSQGLSVHINPGANACPTTSVLFPFVFESQRVAFLRAFGSWNGLFGGVDAEANLDFNQLRVMAQLGVAR